MRYFDEIMARLRNGETAEDICNEFTDAMNAAEQSLENQSRVKYEVFDTLAEAWNDAVDIVAADADYTNDEWSTMIWSAEDAEEMVNNWVRTHNVVTRFVADVESAPDNLKNAIAKLVEDFFHS